LFGCLFVDSSDAATLYFQNIRQKKKEAKSVFAQIAAR
jgi:hypothetical protein